MPSLASLLRCGDAGICIMQYLEAVDAINLTRTSTELYTALPRNSAFGISVWRLYLSSSVYISNRLVFETGKFLLDSDQVSRANYKMILCVLVEKNGFMKTLKLKSLCSSGKLSAPIIPKSGRWRDLVRLDQFALKRAASSPEEKTQPLSSGISIVSFVSRLAGRPGKEAIVGKQVAKLDGGEVSELIALLMCNNNLPGVSQVVDLRPKEAESVLVSSVVPYKDKLQDNAIHTLLRDTTFTNSIKYSCLSTIMKFACTRPLLHEINLMGETPLHLSPSREIYSLLVSHGADPNVPNNKGELARGG